MNAHMLVATPEIWNAQTIRDAERASILEFMEAQRGYLTGRALDFGAGKEGTCRTPEPYRHLVSGEYLPFDLGDVMPAGPFDVIMCNQVLQYVPDPVALLREFALWLKPGGHLVMTYATNWAEAEACDLWRMTRYGMEYALRLAGITVLHHQRRFEVALGSFTFPIGYGVVGLRPGPRTQLTADESAAVLTEKIRNREPFYFVKHGDAAVECIYGYGSGTRDRESYSPRLGNALRSSIAKVNQGQNVFVGDWLTASFEATREGEYAVEYSELMAGSRATFLHFESLLLMRESRALVDFYSAVARDPRRKLLMGPAKMAGAAKMLRAEHLIIPMQDLFAQVDLLSGELLGRDFDVLLYGAGMAGHIPVTRCWERFPERTYVNIGSALDILFMGRSRRQQIPLAKAQRMFRELL